MSGDGTGPVEAEDWRAQRAEAARAHAESLARRQAGEHAQARAMLAEFLTEAERRGVAPVPLHARSYDGRFRYRTPLRGWYLRRNQSVAVSTSGDFYVLSVAPSLRALVSGAHPEPSEPPLVLGKGARDGESIDLADALAIVLAEGADRR